MSKPEMATPYVTQEAFDKTFPEVRTYRSGRQVVIPSKIEKDIPAPTARSPSLGPVYSQAEKLEVGDSFTVPYARGALCGNLERHTGFRLTQRKQGEVLRIWRLADE